MAVLLTSYVLCSGAAAAAYVATGGRTERAPSHLAVTHSESTGQATGTLRICSLVFAHTSFFKYPTAYCSSRDVIFMC